MITVLFIIAFFMIGLAIYIEIFDKRRLARMAEELRKKS